MGGEIIKKVGTDPWDELRIHDSHYQPLPEELTIKESPIQGLGLFALADIEVGHEFGITHVMFLESFHTPIVRTPLGGFYNHSKNPNCETYGEDDSPRFIQLRAIKDIKAGEELTAFYTLYSMEDE